MLGQNLTSVEQGQLNELLQLDRFRLKMMYWELPTPAIGEVAGEYDAQLLDQGDRVGTLVTRKLFGSKGPWLGKAFRPLSNTEGEGYNAFGSAEDRQALLPMDTYIDHSNIVPGYSYILDYQGKNWGPIRWLRGELRTVSPSVLLGMGTFGPRRRSLHKLRRVIPFVLVLSDRGYLDHDQSAPSMKLAS